MKIHDHRDLILVSKPKGDENKLQLLEMGAMEAIANLITHEDKIVKRYAVMAYGVSAGNGNAFWKFLFFANLWMCCIKPDLIS